MSTEKRDVKAGEEFTRLLLQNVVAERGWHAGPIDRTDGIELARSITSANYHLIYTAIPERVYGPVDMSKNIAWEAVKSERDRKKLSETHARLFFQNPRPLFELSDVKKDPYQLDNLSGEQSLKAVESDLRSKLDLWMVRESDFLPLPSHARSQFNSNKQ